MRPHPAKMIKQVGIGMAFEYLYAERVRTLHGYDGQMGKKCELQPKYEYRTV